MICDETNGSKGVVGAVTGGSSNGSGNVMI